MCEGGCHEQMEQNSLKGNCVRGGFALVLCPGQRVNVPGLAFESSQAQAWTVSDRSSTACSWLRFPMKSCSSCCRALKGMTLWILLLLVSWDRFKDLSLLFL